MFCCCCFSTSVFLFFCLVTAPSEKSAGQNNDLGPSKQGQYYLPLQVVSSTNKYETILAVVVLFAPVGLNEGQDIALLL